MTFSRVLMKQEASKLRFIDNIDIGGCQADLSSIHTFSNQTEDLSESYKWKKNRMRTGLVSAGEGTLTSLN